MWLPVTINLLGLEKRFDAFHLGPITVTLRGGTAYGLLGPNGAGKTTLLNLLTAQLRPTAGECRVDDRVITSNDTAWKDQFSYVRETPVFYDALTVAQTLTFASKMYEHWNADLARSLTSRLGLDPRKRVAALSKGTRVKLGLAVALAHRTRLIVLDEPSAGLDPTVRADLQAVLRELIAERPDLVLLLSSHIFEDIERVCTDVLVMRDGRIVTHVAMADLPPSMTLEAVYREAQARP